MTLEKTSFEVKTGEQMPINVTFCGEIGQVTFDIDDKSICTFISSQSHGEENITMFFQARSTDKTEIAIQLLDRNGDVIIFKTAAVTVIFFLSEQNKYTVQVSIT